MKTAHPVTCCNCTDACRYTELGISVVVADKCAPDLCPVCNAYFLSETEVVVPACASSRFIQAIKAHYRDSEIIFQLD